MRYMLGFIKIIVLGLLVATSIYQTGKLWFEDTSDRNFFYDGSKTVGTSGAVNDISDDVLVPEQLGIYINEDNIEYAVLSRGASSYGSMLDASVDVTQKTLEKGSYRGSYEEVPELWENRHVILVLPFSYSGDDLSSGFGIATAKTKNIDRVSAIYIVPAEDEGKSVNLFFENTEGDQAIYYQFEINQDTLKMDNELLAYFVENIAANRENMAAYISTQKNDMLRYYKRTILLPMSKNDIQYHKNIFWEIPYVSEGVIDEGGVQQMVRTFFENPDVLSKSSINQGIRFTSGNTSVRYDMNGIMEYTTIADSNVDMTLSEAVALSQQFISRMTKNATTEYALIDYEINDISTTVYYNMSYNGFPVVMPDEAKEAYGMTYPAQVTLSGGQVTRFTTMVREIPERLPQFDTFDISLVEAADHLISEVGDLDGAFIDDMYLGYRWADNEEKMTLSWIVEVNDARYFLEVGAQ